MEREGILKQNDNGLLLTCDIEDVLTYAAVHNSAHIVRDMRGILHFESI